MYLRSLYGLTTVSLLFTASACHAARNLGKCAIGDHANSEMKETIGLCLINLNAQALCFWTCNYSGHGNCFWIAKGSSRQHFGHQTVVHSIAP